MCRSHFDYKLRILWSLFFSTTILKYSMVKINNKKMTLQCYFILSKSVEKSLNFGVPVMVSLREK